MAQQPLPDFTRAGHHFTEASNEIQVQFQRMNIVPSVQLTLLANQLTELAQAVAQINQAIVRIDGSVARLSESVVRIDQSIGRLDTKIDTNNLNNTARLQNTYARSPDDPLTALVNTTTGAFIPNFPSDSASITRSNATQIKALLQELGQTIPNSQAGGIALLRRQLRVQLGLRGEQAQGA